MQLDLAGQDVTDALMEKLTRGGYPQDSINPVTVRGIKEKFAYMALDCWKDFETARQGPAFEKSYELLDREVITTSVSNAPKSYSSRGWMGCTQPGFTRPSIIPSEKCDDAIRKDLYGNIVLSGGSTMFPGMANRSSKEITAPAPSGAEIKVVAPPERKYGAWIGEGRFLFPSAKSSRKSAF